MRIDCELTDTFGGQPNYSWVQRESVELPEGATDRQIVMAGKRALGLSGVRCDRETWNGDTFVLRPHGACVVAFLTIAE